jgi:hypothetical protein
VSTADVSGQVLESTTAPTTAPTTAVPLVGRTVHIGTRVWPVVLPSFHDARLHAAAVVLTIHVLGQVAFDFAVSIPQIVAAILGSAVVEFVIIARRDGVLAWPASAMLTGSGVALILRVDGTAPGDHWSFHRWWWFALIAIGSLLTKYLIRWRGAHLFNPSNVGLVAAFLVLGSGRVEPLPLHWSGTGVSLGLAYLVIIVGGVLITRRLGLLLMAACFWLAFSVGLGVLARSGHCMTVPWTPRSVCDGEFWWTVAASPEVFLFVFFMLTDPRTVPPTGRARVGFALGVAVIATMLIAPQRTEFGTKVGLLAALAITCASRPVTAAVRRRWAPRVRALVGPMSPDERGVLVGVAAIATVIVFVVATVSAGAHAREPSPVIASESLPPVPAIEWTAPVSVVEVTFEPLVLELDSSMADRQERRGLLLAVLENLAIEGALMEAGDAESLAAVAHGARLSELRSMLSQSSVDEATMQWPSYEVSTARLVVRRAGRQASGVLTLDVTGTKTALDETTPWSAFIGVRQASDGRWLIVELTER